MPDLDAIEDEIERRWMNLFGDAAQYGCRALSDGARNAVADAIEDIAESDGVASIPVTFPVEWRRWWHSFIQTAERCETHATIPSDVPNPPPWNPELWHRALRWAEEDTYPFPVFILSIARALTSRSYEPS